MTFLFLTQTKNVKKLLRIKGCIPGHAEEIIVSGCIKQNQTCGRIKNKKI
jgi:hypothetical protein